MVEFTSKHDGWWDRHPDYFVTARRDMRFRFTDLIRRYFKKGLLTVVETGTRHQGTPMPARRAIFYLGIIHSDKNDKLHILGPGQPEVWASMIELKRDTSFLSDYLANVDEAYRSPIDFQLADGGVDPLDGSREWIVLFDDLDRALADGVVSRSELAGLQKMTRALRGRIDRFDNDAMLGRILDDIDLAAGTEIYKDAEPQRPGTLARNYRVKFETFERHIAWAKDPDLRKQLRVVLDWVNAAAIDVAPPHSLGDLVFRLEQLYGPDTAASPDETAKVTVVKIGGTERRLPSGLWVQIIRDSKAEQYVDSFLASPIDQGTLFGADAGALAPVRWSPSGDGDAVFVGHGVLDGRYTKLAYDKYIGGMAVRLTAVLARSHVSNQLRNALNANLGEQIARYAARYRDEGVRFAQSFDVQAGSEEALRVAVGLMKKDDKEKSSNFNDFLGTLDQNTRLDAPATVSMLSSIHTEMMTFDAWHQVVGGGSGAPEITKYRSIMERLLEDLGPPAAAGAPEPAAPAAPAARRRAGASAAGAPQGDTGTETLEKLLTPAGRLYLAWLRGEKGSYSVLVENWLTSIRMPEDQRKAFRAPLRRLAELGRHDIERVISRMWHVAMLPSLQRVATKFPFDRATTVEASPDEIKELFHPKDGRMFDLFRRYVEPISQISGTSVGFHPLPTVARGGLSLPGGLYAAINASAALSTRLWDQTGNPTPIKLKVSTVRFERRAQPKEGEAERASVLTLMYLNVGEGSVFNFNQQPSLVTVGFDWTKDSRSQVGIQFTDSQTKENTFPPAIVSRGTYWSLYHLLLRAKPSPVRFPPGAQLPDLGGVEPVRHLDGGAHPGPLRHGQRSLGAVRRHRPLRAAAHLSSEGGPQGRPGAAALPLPLMREAPEGTM